MNNKSYLPSVGDVLSANSRDSKTNHIITREYVIGEQYRSGGRGVVLIANFAATNKPFDHSDRKLVIKVPNLDETRSKLQIDNRIEEFHGDIRREQNAWTRLSLNLMARQYIAQVFDVGSYPAPIRGEEYTIPFLVQEFIDGKSLSEWCLEKYTNPLTGTFTGISNPDAWFAISRQLISIVALFHQERIVHSDIWQPNILIRNSNNNPVFIDFGQAWREDMMFVKSAQDSKPYSYYAPERLRSGGGPWYAPADLYSICGILYYLATGDDPPLTVEIEDGNKIGKDIGKTTTKNEIVATIRNTNPSLYRANLGVPDIILYGLRPIPHERASYAEEILEVLDLYRNAYNGTIDDMSSAQQPAFEQVRKSLMQMIREIDKAKNDVLCKLIGRDLFYLETQLQQLYAETGTAANRQRQSQLYYLPGGDRDELVKYLMTAFAALRRGDEVLAQTTPIFWRKRNFGANGRFLTMLKMAAVNGVTIRWVLLIDEEDEWNDSEVHEMLNAQRVAALEAHEIAGIKIREFELSSGGIYFGYHRMPHKERDELVSSAKTFVVLNQKSNTNSDNLTLIAPTYTQPKVGNIASVRLWRQPMRWEEEFLPTLDEHLRLSICTVDYLPILKSDSRSADSPIASTI